jgi:hypothetical protein
MDEVDVMAIFTYSPKQIRSLELTLRAKLSKSALNRPRAELDRYVKERFAQRKAQRSQFDRLLTQASVPIMELLKKDKRYAASAEAFRKLATDELKKMRARRLPRTNPKFDPRPIANSGLRVRVPPYDRPGTGGAGKFPFFEADEKTGRYYLGLVPSFGAAAWAGVAANLVSLDSSPRQRVGVLVDYGYAWRDVSWGGKAHNDATTNVWIWGFSEGLWVSSSWRFDPQWSDGTSLFEDHGSGGDGSFQSGRESLEVTFNARANSLYQVWVWSDGSADDDFFSYASQRMFISVPLIVLGPPRDL